MNFRSRMRQRRMDLFGKREGRKCLTKSMAEGGDRETYLAASLRETIIFAFTFAMVLSFVVGAYNPSMYNVTKNLEDMTVHRKFLINGKLNTFKEVQKFDDLWVFLETILLNGVHWDNWFDDVLHDLDRDDKEDPYEVYLIGVVRLRQLRVRNNTCEVHPIFKSTIQACYGHYNWDNRETRPFGLMTGDAWTYHAPEYLDANNFYGDLSNYDGGGYYQNLRRMKNESQFILQELRQNMWLSRHSRILFVDYTTFFPNHNLFCQVKIVFEIGPSGGLVKTYRIYPARLLKYNRTHHLVLFGCEVVYYVMMIYYSVQTVREMRYFKWKYFRHFWGYVDLCILLNAYVVFSMGLYQYFKINAKITEIKSYTRPFYPNFEDVILNETTHNAAAAVLVFFYFLKIFQYTSWNSVMSIMTDTMSKCAWDLFGLFFMFLIIFGAFAQLGYLLYGPFISHYKSFQISVFTLLQAILGRFDYFSIEKVNRTLAPIYFIFFIFFVFFILLNMFLAIISDAYSEVVLIKGKKKEEMYMSDYVRKQLLQVAELLHVRKYIKIKPKVDKKNQMEKEVYKMLEEVGFPPYEIDMFFDRFNLLENVTIKDYNIEELKEDLKNTQFPKTKSPYQISDGQNYFITDDGSVYVYVHEFKKQNLLLDDISSRLDKMYDEVDALQSQLDKILMTRQFSIDTSSLES